MIASSGNIAERSEKREIQERKQEMKDKFQMSVEDNSDFAKRIIVDSIYREARVEGINVTFPETQQIYDGLVVSDLGYEDVAKIINLKHAWYFLLETLEYPVNLRYLRHLNFLIQSNIMRTAGSIREISVRISGTDCVPEIPTVEKIEAELDRIRSIASPTERAIELMLSVMRGQYFDDGNKRTAQLIANHELISHGCGVLSVPDDRLTEFSGLLVNFYETNQKDQIKSFLYDMCISGYDRKRTISDEELRRQRQEDEDAIREFLGRKRSLET